MQYFVIEEVVFFKLNEIIKLGVSVAVTSVGWISEEMEIQL